MPVEWIRKTGSADGVASPSFTVSILPNAVSLSAALRNELISHEGKKPGIYVLFGAQGKRLALVKARPDDADAWYFNPKTGRTHNKKLLALLAERGFTEGRYVMEWSKRSRCYLSTETLAVTPRRRRTEKASA